MTFATRMVLELAGVAVTDLAGISGLALDREFLELKQTGPNGEIIVQRVPGAWRPGEVSLTRRTGTDPTFHSWVQTGQVVPPGGTAALVLFDDAGAPVRRYVLADPWARRVEVSTHTEGGVTALMETLVLGYSRIDLQ